MAFNFTDDQRMALEFPGNVIISAGAGSGKTRVLVEKYFRLLVDQHPEWPVDSVVAITFTRKAASELKSRIIGRVLMELDTEPVDTPRRARLLELRTEVGAAPIGTIHTFCGRILREFAFDANLDPDYAVIEGAQEGALRLTAAKDTIAEATAAKGQEIYQDLLSLLNVFSPARLIQILAGMLAGRTTFTAPASRYLSTSVNDLFEDLLAFHREYADELRLEIGAEWKRLFDALAASSEPGKIRDIAEAAVAAWPDDCVSNWLSCSAIVDEAIGAFFTKSGTCRKREFKQAGFEESATVWVQAEALLEKYNDACLDEPGEDDRADLELTRRLARLFVRAAEHYDKLRGGEGDEGEAQLMDFADLEIFAERLIQSSADLRRQIRERYPYLIIDEFQDTSQAQWNILRPVVTDEDGQLRKSSLFVVGDRKQGVYGFRDANVALFSEVQSAVTASNEEWRGSRGYVTMAANFRTNPVPLYFINNVFQSLLSEASNLYSVEFDPLTPMRLEKEGCVEFLRSIPDGGDDEDAKFSAAEHRACEAALVAAHVKSLIDSGEAQPGNIALLFRKKSVFADYEAALKQHGIACVTQFGENLFHQPELADLVAALNSVVYPHRDLEFMHYLRSPFVGCSDDLLLKVARTHGRSFWDKANAVLARGKFQLDQQEYPLSQLEIDRLNFAISLLRRARKMVGVASPYEVLKYIVTELGARHTVLSGHRGKQAASNIDKLLLIARSAEGLSFEEFLEFIKSEEESLKGTSEAADLTATDAVRIMTIHAAKGLEFPVVYLPDLNSGTSGRGNDVYGDGNRWMTLVPPREYTPKHSFLVEYFRMISRKQQAAEERRVFYVAMTRCEHRLILCASPDCKARGETFYQWISSRFAEGESAGLLKSQKDFAEVIAAASENLSSSEGKLRGSRDARLQQALTDAGTFNTAVLALDNDASSSHASVVASELPLFLNQVWNRSLEDALVYLEQQLEVLQEESRRQWIEILMQVGAWVLEEFREDKTVEFSRTLRFKKNGKVASFTPHITTETRCGWIILPGMSRELLLSEKARYENAATGLHGVPECFTWDFTSGILLQVKN